MTPRRIHVAFNFSWNINEKSYSIREVKDDGTFHVSHSANLAYLLHYDRNG